MNEEHGSLQRIVTPIGTYWFDPSSDDARVGIAELTTVDALGPDSTYSWSLDQEEALLWTARELHAQLDLVVAGGWRVTPCELMPRFIETLKLRAARTTPTSRMTPKRG